MLRNILVLTALFFGLSSFVAAAGECIAPGAGGDLKIRQIVMTDATESQTSVTQRSFVDHSTGKVYSVLPTKQEADDAAQILQAAFQDRKLHILQVRDSDTHETVGYITVMQSDGCGDRYDPPDKNG